MSGNSKHELAGGTLNGTRDGIVARCICGWSSGCRITSLIASSAFRDHQESAAEAEQEPQP